MFDTPPVEGVLPEEGEGGALAVGALPGVWSAGVEV
jgi:hypothetical protein